MRTFAIIIILPFVCVAALTSCDEEGTSSESTACVHVEVADPAVSPTCQQTGLTEGSHCEICGKVLTEQKSVPVVGHDYADGVCSMCGAEAPVTLEDMFVFTELENGTYQIKANDKSKLPKDLVIPTSYKGKTVSAIDGSAFKDCKGLTSITIPEGITLIGKSAFEGCKNLTKIFYNATECSALPMENKAFYNAGASGDGIKVIIGANVKEIPESLFYSKNSQYSSSPTSPKIVSVEFEEGSVCELIGNHSFFDCHYLVSVKIPDSVKEVDHAAFYNCKSLTELDLGNGVKTIDNAAFYGCDSLKTLTIPAQVELIVYRAFNYCTSLTTLNFNPTHCTIWEGGKVFADMGAKSGGVTVVVGANVKSLPAHLFEFDPYYSEPPKIAAVRFERGSVCGTIGWNAFKGCQSLTDIYYPGTEDAWKTIAIYEGNEIIQSATIHYQAN